MSARICIEEQLYHLKAISRGHGTEWEVGFARSILKHSKRSNWHPSNKQKSTIDRMVAEHLRTRGEPDTDDISLIEDMGGQDAA